MLRKRGDTWWIDIQHGGRRFRRSCGTTDRTQAQEYHDHFKAALWKEARLGQKQDLSVKKAAAAWLQAIGQHKRSAQDDALRLRVLSPLLSGLTVQTVTADTLRQVRATVLERGVSQATANRYMALLSTILRYAHRQGWSQGVPSVPMTPETEGRIRWITPDEANALLRELPEHLRRMARFTLATGLRRRNVTHLEWQHVDLPRGVAHVTADQAKAKRAIGVPLNGDALAVLDECQGDHPRFVFVYENQPVLRTGTKAWTKACARAGLTDLHWHDLRHTWASWHIMSGTPIQVLKELGGWASLEMVLRYAHLSPHHLSDAARNVQGWSQKRHSGEDGTDQDDAKSLKNWGERWDSNPRQPESQSGPILGNVIRIKKLR